MTTIKANELLRLAAQTIKTPESWCAGWYARNIDGDDVTPTSKEATSWCILGAMIQTADMPIRQVTAREQDRSSTQQTQEYTRARKALKDVLMSDQGPAWVRDSFKPEAPYPACHEVSIISHTNDWAHRTDQQHVLTNACLLAAQTLEEGT